MASFYLAPDPLQSTQLIPGGNSPASGGLLFTYVAGSSTKTTVYKDNAGNASWTNPIVLDSGGNLPNNGMIWIPTGVTLDAVLAPSNDTDPPSSPYWTKEDITGVNDISGVVSEWITGPAPTFVTANSFTLVGDQTGIFTIGRRVRSTNTAGTRYGTITRSVFGAATTVTLQMDSGSLDSGLSAVSYGIIAAANPSTPAATINAQPTCYGRLSLSSSQPISSTDIASATAFWFLPYGGNTVDIYDGSANWNRFTFSAMSSAVPNTSVVMHDVTIYNSTGVLALSSTAWTNDTTRAVGITRQNGVEVLTGALGHLFLGSYRTTNTPGQVDDTRTKRYLSNRYNQEKRHMMVAETTASWSYAGVDYRQANASALNQLDFVCSVPMAVEATATHSCLGSDVVFRQFATGIGLDSTTVNSSVNGLVGANNSVQVGAVAEYKGVPGAGRHRLVWLESGNANSTMSFNGFSGVNSTQTGIVGEIFG